MTEITAALVKELRIATGAGMMDCKKALMETGGDKEAAVDWLRKKGLAAAAKKTGRVAAEGLVGVRTEGNRGALVEVNSETDFVARNEAFQTFVSKVCDLALSGGGDVEALQQVAYPGSGRSVAEETTDLVATIGENINLRRVAALEVERGIVCGYVHNQAAPGLGKIGVLVGLQADAADGADLAGLGKQLAMHVTAAQPQFLSVETVDAAILARERAILEEQAGTSGKPAEIVAKMVEGRLRKYYQEVVLLEQTFVIDGETKVSKVVEGVAGRLDTAIAVTGFVRFVLGEGVEKKSDDFAEEVAKLAG